MPEPIPIVRCELLGGLGNQLFQAATAFALAKRLGATLEFDITRFRKGGARAYALAGLDHGGRLVGGDVSPLSRLATRAMRIASLGRIRRPQGWRGSVFREASYAYDPRFETLVGSVFLSGYFHSARYFAPYETEIRSAFDIARRASPQALAKAAALPENTLSVHVRIGDFGHSGFSAVHGTLPPAYYRHAIGLVDAAKKPDRIFVFTDTPEAVAALMPEGLAYELVTGNSAEDDLFLMSRAKHHIIANSTFSWWSAWLAPQSGSLTIAPKQWLSAEALAKTDVSDLFPEGWIVV